jgi:basic membrane lipoprotein Med (substrate-binding protein (PBP1-ABC) superfamily)
MVSRKGRAAARPFRLPGLCACAALALLAAGCGSGKDATTPRATTARAAAAPTLLRAGVVGPLRLDVPGVRVRRGSLGAVAGEQLVLVAAGAATVEAVAASARAHPDSQFAIVGASARAQDLPNLAGIVFEEGKAAYLAGVTAGLAATAAGGEDPRVAWVGPEDRVLVTAFGRGVRAAAPGVALLHQESLPVPARCKEAALTALERDAVVVFARRGLCAAAAAAAAHEQNRPALRLRDFVLPIVAAAAVAREAVGGVFHGGEDVVFGPATGAVGVRALDPRISFSTAAKARAAAQQLAGGVAQAG